MKKSGFKERMDGWISKGRARVKAMRTTHNGQSGLHRSLFAVTFVGLLVGVVFMSGLQLRAGVGARLDSEGGAVSVDEPLAEIQRQGSGLISVVPGTLTEPEPLTRRPAETGTAPAAPDPRAAAPAGDGHPKVSAETSPPAAGGAANVAAPPTASALPVVSTSDMVWPVSGYVVRPFGWYRDPVFGDWRHTSSTALEPDPSDRSVKAAMAGRVRDVVNEGGLYRVTVEHAEGWVTQYEGLVAVAVESYSVIATGSTLGTAPAPGSGRALTFSVLSAGMPVDPQELLGEPIVPVGAR